MIKKIKVWDVVEPQDDWGKNYAKLEYAHTGLKQTFSTKIEVQDNKDPLEVFWSDAPTYDFITGELIEDKDHYYDRYDDEGRAEV